MKVKILTEGDIAKGFGHIYRCQTIFEVFDDVDMFIDIDYNTYQKFFANYKQANWQNTQWVNSHLTSDDLVIIDSYHLSLDVLEVIQKIAFKVIVIDDLHRLAYKNLIILNPNNFGDMLDYHCSNTVFAGIPYMLTRPIFDTLQRTSINEEVKNVFMMIGGTDLLNVTPKLVAFLKKSHSFLNCCFHIVVPDLTNYDVNDKRFNFYTKLAGEEIVNLMHTCDIAITAGGQTLNELIKTSTPFACIMVSDNQRANIDGILAKNLGLEFTKDDFSNIEKLLEYGTRLVFFENMQEYYQKTNGSILLKKYIEEEFYE